MASDEPRDIPALPGVLLRPAPVIIAGMLAFGIAAVVFWLIDRDWSPAVVISLVGLGVGAFGTTLVTLQIRGARRGNRGAQQGLDF